MRTLIKDMAIYGISLFSMAAFSLGMATPLNTRIASESSGTSVSTAQAQQANWKEQAISSRLITMKGSSIPKIDYFRADRKAIFIYEAYEGFDGNTWYKTMDDELEPVGNEDVSKDIELEILSDLCPEIKGIYSGNRKKGSTLLEEEIDSVYRTPLTPVPDIVEKALCGYLGSRGYNAGSLEELARLWPEMIDSASMFNEFCDDISHFVRMNSFYHLENPEEDDPLVKLVETSGSRAEKAFEMMVGDCEYGNVMLASILREIGIPTRQLDAWVCKEGNNKNGHAMTQAWNPYTGWTIFDGTPANRFIGFVEDVDDIVSRMIDYWSIDERGFISQLQFMKYREELEDIITEMEKRDILMADELKIGLNQRFEGSWCYPDYKIDLSFLDKDVEPLKALMVAFKYNDKDFMKRALRHYASKDDLKEKVYLQIIDINKYKSSDEEIEAKAFSKLGKERQNSFIKKITSHYLEHPHARYRYYPKASSECLDNEQAKEYFEFVVKNLEKIAMTVHFLYDCKDLFNLYRVRRGIELIESHPHYDKGLDRKLDLIEEQAMENHPKAYKQYISFFPDSHHRIRDTDIAYPVVE